MEAFAGGFVGGVVVGIAIAPIVLRWLREPF
jgi:hypothetical protein